MQRRHNHVYKSALILTVKWDDASPTQGSGVWKPQIYRDTTIRLTYKKQLRKSIERI